jgi:hypothetical protein
MVKLVKLRLDLMPFDQGYGLNAAAKAYTEIHLIPHAEQITSGGSAGSRCHCVSFRETRPGLRNGGRLEVSVKVVYPLEYCIRMVWSNRKRDLGGRKLTSDV